MSRFKAWRTATHQTLEFRESKLSLWHSFTFATNICAPLLLGWLHYDARLGPLGGILGMLFSLSDASGELRQRLGVLLRSAGVILFFGLIGHWLSSTSFIFWTLLIGLSLAAWVSLSGSNLVSPLRYSALAVVTASTTKGLGVPTIVLLIFAAATVAINRSIGQIFFHDDKPVLPNPATRTRPNFLLAVRYSGVYAAAVSTALAVGISEGINRPIWVATTVLLVMQPDPKLSYQRIFQRLLGTCVGVGLATLVVHTVHSETLLALSIAVIASMLPHGAARNYWLQSAFVAGLVLVLLDFGLSGENFDLQLLGERIRDVSLGCAIAIAGTLLAFPPSYRKDQSDLAPA